MIDRRMTTSVVLGKYEQGLFNPKHVGSADPPKSEPPAMELAAEAVDLFHSGDSEIAISYG